mmetsp:Transcript_23592/g.65005  ORF Transcript_23592/g.65005 Transcript_23592/m.65005 type:complete len:260 (-) Transcript_23592:140-919(-)
MMVFTTSMGLATVVVTRPVNMLDASWASKDLSPSPVYATMALLASSYVAHWLAVRVAARAMPGMAPLHSPCTPSAATTARSTPSVVVCSGFRLGACSRVFKSSVGLVMAAAKHPDIDPAMILRPRPCSACRCCCGTLDCRATRVRLVGAYKPRRKPPYSKPRATEGANPLVRADMPSLRNMLVLMDTMPKGFWPCTWACSCNLVLHTSMGLVKHVADATAKPLIPRSKYTGIALFPIASCFDVILHCIGLQGAISGHNV